MQHIKMPAFYYPTQVVLIDDNPKILESIKETLLKKNIVCQTFEDPQKALVYLENQPIKQKLMFAVPEEEEDSLANPKPHLNLDFNSIYEQMGNPKRHSEISVIICDYDMPQMKGPDFFGILSNREWKRMMLTGYTDYALAVKLLNQKLIDHYIEKRIGIVDSLSHEIHKLQEAYFNDLTASITPHIFSNNPYINHSDYSALVSQIIQERKFMEHYTFSMSGSKIFIDKAGKKFYLLIATEREMLGYYDTANFADAPESVLQNLKNKTHMPILITEEDFDKSPGKWDENMTQTTRVLLHDTAIYYALISGRE